MRQSIHQPTVSNLDDANPPAEDSTSPAKQKLNITCAECRKVTTLSDTYTNGDGPGRCKRCRGRTIWERILNFKERRWVEHWRCLNCGDLTY